MLSHLWAGAPAPIEYVRLVLCRDVYHCDPIRLAEIPLNIVLEDTVSLSAEAEVAKRRASKK